MKDYVLQNKKTYDLLAKHYADNAYNVSRSIAKIIDPFMACCPQNPAILELGCGAGVATKTLLDRGANVCVVDFSEEMISNAKQRAPKATYFCEDILSWEHDNNIQFDGAFLSAIIHLFRREDAATVLQKVMAKLKPEGCVYLDTTLSSAEYSEQVEPVTYHHSAAPRFRARHTEGSFKLLLESVKLSVIKEWKSIGYDGKSEWIDIIARPVL